MPVGGLYLGCHDYKTATNIDKIKLTKGFSGNEKQKLVGSGER